jgi:heptosyltransferase-2
VPDQLRSLDVAASITLPPSPSAAVLARRVGAPVRVGFAGPLRGLCFSECVVRRQRGSVHLVDEYLELLRRVVPEAPRARPRVLVGDEQARRLRPELGEAGSYLALAPGAIYGPAKRWSAERFAQAAAQLARAHGLGVVLVGGEGDRETCGEVSRRLAATPALDLSGRTSIAELAAVLAGAALVIANDSGPMHLAAAVGAPVVGVFGSTEPGWTAPLGGAVVTAAPRPECAPCYARRCDIGYGCLTAIAVEQVVAAAGQVLDRPAGSSAAAPREERR